MYVCVCVYHHVYFCLGLVVTLGSDTCTDILIIRMMMNIVIKIMRVINHNGTGITAVAATSTVTVSNNKDNDVD